MTLLMSRRQKVRTVLMLVWILSFPITLYYFSPYLPFQALSESIVPGSLLVFGGMFLSSVFLSRLFCGWVCPAGALQHFTAMGRNKQVNQQKVHLIKYILVWFPWVAGLLAMALNAQGPFAVQFDFQTMGGISVANPMAYIIYGSVVLLFVGLSLVFGRRAACHTVCWMAPFMVFGRALGKALRFPQVHLRADSSSCISCGKCDHACPMSLSIKAQVQVALAGNGSVAGSGDSAGIDRPASSAGKPEVQTIANRGQSVSHYDCIGCYQCVDSCPASVLRMHFSTDR